MKKSLFTVAALGLVGVLLAAFAAAPGTTATDFKRYLSTDSTNTSFQQTAGVQTRTTITGLGTPATQLYMLGVQNGKRLGQLKLVPFGAGADNSTFDYRVYLGYASRRVGEFGEPQDGLVKLCLYGWGTVTLGTKTGDGNIVGSTDRYGDTVTWNVAGNGTAYLGIGESIELTQGVISDKYSPADNTEGMVFIPSTGNALFLVIDFDLTGATGANFLVQDEG